MTSTSKGASSRTVGPSLFLLLLVVASGISIGCRDSRPFEAVVVTGRVTFDGQPVANGEIRFFPLEGTTGSVSGAPIIDGQYEVTAKGGVPVGRHTVRIQAFSPDQVPDLTLPSEVAEDFAGDLEQILPAEFNTESELVAEIRSGQSRQILDFSLASEGRDPGPSADPSNSK